MDIIKYYTIKLHELHKTKFNEYLLGQLYTERPELRKKIKWLKTAMVNGTIRWNVKIDVYNNSKKIGKVYTLAP